MSTSVIKAHTRLFSVADTIFQVVVLHHALVLACVVLRNINHDDWQPWDIPDHTQFFTFHILVFLVDVYKWNRINYTTSESMLTLAQYEVHAVLWSATLLSDAATFGLTVDQLHSESIEKSTKAQQTQFALTLVIFAVTTIRTIYSFLGHMTDRQHTQSPTSYGRKVDDDQ